VPTTPAERNDRSRSVRTTAGDLCTRARLLTSLSRQTRLVSVELRRESEALRRRTDPAQRPRGDDGPGVSGFVVFGEVDGMATTATWNHVEGLACSYELRQRVDVVVALGESFVGEDGTSVVASLDGNQTSVLLAVLRAFSRVASVEVLSHLDIPAAPEHG
jgi:hypothetical protein